MERDEVAFDELRESLTDPAVVDPLGVVVGERLMERAGVTGAILGEYPEQIAVDSREISDRVGRVAFGVGVSHCPFSRVFLSVLRVAAHVVQTGASRVASYPSASVVQRVQVVLFDPSVVSQGLSPAVASISMVLWMDTEPVPAGWCNTAAGVSTLSHEPRVRHRVL